MANNRHANAKTFRARLKIDGSHYSYANNLQPNKHAYFLPRVGSSIKQQTKEKNRRREKKTNLPTFYYINKLTWYNVILYVSR